MAQNVDLGSRDWYKREQEQLVKEMEKIREIQRDIIINGFEDSNSLRGKTK